MAKGDKDVLAAQRAHLRIMESIPRERVRTHEQRVPVAEPQGRGTGPLVPIEVRERRRRLVAELLGKKNPSTGRKWTYREIGVEIGRLDQAGPISNAAVAKYVYSLR